MAIDAILDQIEKEQKIDVFGYVTHIRSQRNLMVQTEVRREDLTKYHLRWSSYAFNSSPFWYLFSGTSDE